MYTSAVICVVLVAAVSAFPNGKHAQYETLDENALRARAILPAARLPAESRYDAGYPGDFTQGLEKFNKFNGPLPELSAQAKQDEVGYFQYPEFPSFQSLTGLGPLGEATAIEALPLPQFPASNFGDSANYETGYEKPQAPYNEASASSDYSAQEAPAPVEEYQQEYQPTYQQGRVYQNYQ